MEKISNFTDSEWNVFLNSISMESFQRGIRSSFVTHKNNKTMALTSKIIDQIISFDKKRTIIVHKYTNENDVSFISQVIGTFLSLHFKTKCIEICRICMQAYFLYVYCLVFVCMSVYWFWIIILLHFSWW